MTSLLVVTALGFGCFEPSFPPLESVPFEFVDDGADDFALGSRMGTRALGDVLTLEEAVADGTFLSRVFDAEAVASWKMFEFVPTAPYGTSLPNDGDVETGYASGNIDMTDNILLLHCDGSIDDTSPAQSAVKVSGVAGTPRLLEGVVGQSCRVDAPSDLEVQVGANGPLNFGTSDYTWATWVRTVTSCEGNHVVLGADAQLDPGGAHNWFGCAQAPSQGCSGTGGFFSGIQSSTHSSDGISFCGTTVINDGNWHHVALVKRGHASAMIAAYVDGQIEDLAEGSFQMPISYPAENVFGIGRYPDDGFDPTASTEIDELAVWRRALSADEIGAIYERGAFGVSLGVAVCSGPSCEGPFTNAADDPESNIEDLGLGAPPEAIELEVPVGRYFRYRIQMSQMSNAFNLPNSPEIRRVGVSGRR